MSWISVDVEADGPIPGEYSMIALGACLVADTSVGYVGYLQPISSKWDPEALAVSGFSRDETMNFDWPKDTMVAFYEWIVANAKPPYIFVADNNGFDWSFVNWYFHKFIGKNPFGFSSKNINSLYHGLMGDTFASFKHLRKTKHDHNPLNDAKGNAEALQYMKDEMKLKVKF